MTKYTNEEIENILNKSQWQIDIFGRCNSVNCKKLLEIIYQLKDEQITLSDDYEYFDNWFEQQERRFHCGAFSDKDIGYSSFIEGMKFKK